MYAGVSEFPQGRHHPANESWAIAAQRFAPIAFELKGPDMARPGSVPITRLRFRGRTEVLLTLCQLMRDNPGVGLTANQAAQMTGLTHRDVRQRFAETPELFIRVRKSKDGNTRYRLASSIASLSPDGVVAFIDAETRAETRLAAIVIFGIIAVGVAAGVLSSLH